MKFCTKCQKELSLEQFHKNKKKSDGLAGQCKLCSKKQMRSWYLRNKQKVNASSKKWRQQNLEKMKEYNKKHYAINKDSRLEKQWEYVKEKCSQDIQFRLSRHLRSRLHTAIKGNTKAGSAVKDLGCSIEELRIYLESKFKPGMSWDNWGRNGWHIDHIIPLASFDLTERNQVLQACHYTNLQPLWARDNLCKGGKSC